MPTGGGRRAAAAIGASLTSISVPSMTIRGAAIGGDVDAGPPASHTTRFFDA